MRYFKMYPASSGFFRPDATQRKRSIRPGETTARRVVLMKKKKEKKMKKRFEGNHSENIRRKRSFLKQLKNFQSSCDTVW